MVCFVTQKVVEIVFFDNEVDIGRSTDVVDYYVDYIWVVLGCTTESRTKLKTLQ